jgi:hypothetical protein
MVSFTFPTFKALTIMGVAEIVLGLLLLVGVLRSRKGVVARIAGGIALVAFGVFFVTIRSTGEIVVREGSLQLRVPFQRDKLIDSADIRSVTEIDIYSSTGMKPVRKISGGNIGDVRTGWYSLSSGEKAFLTLQGTRALYIETSRGFNAIVGMHDFEAFEAAFAEHVYRE